MHYSRPHKNTFFLNDISFRPANVANGWAAPGAIHPLANRFKNQNTWPVLWAASKSMLLLLLLTFISSHLIAGVALAATCQEWPATPMPVSSAGSPAAPGVGTTEFSTAAWNGDPLHSNDSNVALIQSTTIASGRGVQITAPNFSPQYAIKIQGVVRDQWQQGAYQAKVLSQIRLTQGKATYTADHAVIWVDPSAPIGLSPGGAAVSNEFSSDIWGSQNVRQLAVIYLEGNVAIGFPRSPFSTQESVHNSAPNLPAVNPPSHSNAVLSDQDFDWIRDQQWLGTLASDLPLEFKTDLPEQNSIGFTSPARSEPGLAQRALSYWQQEVANSQRPSPIGLASYQSTDNRYQANQSLPAALGNPLLSPQSQGAPTASPNAAGPLNFAINSSSTLGAADLAPIAAQSPDPGSPAVFGVVPPGQGSGIFAPGQNLAGSDSQPVKVQIFPRNTGVDLNLRNVPGRIPGEQMILGTGGVKVVVDSQMITQNRTPGSNPSGVATGERLVIQADNIVAWTNQIASMGGSETTPRWELFLEGNVIFALGQRVVYANKMYYDVNMQMGTILDAEMLSPVPEFEGLIRLRADVLQQINQQQFRAYGAAVTTSRMGIPRYWLESRELDLTRTKSYDADPASGVTAIDPSTGLPAIKDSFTVESYDNFINVLGRPFLYWPVFKTNLDNPEYYLQNFAIKNDNIFGFQALTNWNLYQVLGMEPVEGTQWTGSLDYLSNRGLGLGSKFNYTRDNGFVFPGMTSGYYDSWFLVSDSGLDNLGADRRNVTLEETQRGRSVWRHDHRFRNGDRLLGEFGWISDRNFLEQFYEREWDQEKDQATSVRYQRLRENRMFEISGDANVNDFFTQTQWLPRVDFTVLAQPVLGSRVTWHSNSHVGYADLKVGDAPTNAVDLAKYDPLAWEAEREGLRIGTRQELEVPFQLGALKVVPYALGDATYWGEDLTGDDLTRLYGQTGIRTSLPMWRVDPNVQSQLFNLNGLAHKVTFQTDFLYADANKDLDQLPLYDAIDDDAQEHFRRRFAFDTFGILPGGNTPVAFDERFFALRSGLQGFVSSPANEIADDLTLFKFGVNQRWQTKRGTPGRERIIDWVTLDLSAQYFPQSDRDNFGEDFGMIDYDFRWHIGDRLAFLSDGYFDTFQDGLQTASVGLAANRPESGDVYIGFRTIDGPINSQTINARVNYRLSPKWILRASNSWDFGNTGRIGQTLGATYIGESFLWYFGSNADFSRDNVGFIFSIEPRGIPGGRQGRLGGVAIAPAGVRGLE